MKTISGGNYFYEKAFDEICAELEKGETVQVYIDCIGHWQNNTEQEAYKEALLRKYNDRLTVKSNEGGYSFSYNYTLK